MRRDAPMSIKWSGSIVIALVLGFLFATALQDRSDERAHDRGYADGLAACDGPSRLERAANWVAR